MTAKSRRGGRTSQRRVLEPPRLPTRAEEYGRRLRLTRWLCPTCPKAVPRWKNKANGSSRVGIAACGWTRHRTRGLARGHLVPSAALGHAPSGGRGQAARTSCCVSGPKRNRGRRGRDLRNGLAMISQEPPVDGCASFESLTAKTIGTTSKCTTSKRAKLCMRWTSRCLNTGGGVAPRLTTDAFTNVSIRERAPTAPGGCS